MNPARWQKIEKIYYAALESAEENRADFLDEICADDLELRREIESLLAESDSNDGFLSKSPLNLGMALVSNQAENALAGETIGHYKILKMLGQGGMGEVFLAEDTNLARRVALKMLPAFLTEEADSIRRFRQEARAASAISHPNVAHIYETGNTNNRHFIAMEYVEGVTLRDLLNEKPPDVVSVLDIALQIANALRAAHAAGVIHRDIKPENIMLRADGFVKVLDFGLAKPMVNYPTNDEDDTLQVVQTQPGMVLGSVRYMSPEQARGKETDEKTDIWSLGVVIYEMLAGQTPFDGDTPSDILAALLLKEPAPLSLSSVGEKENSILREIVGKTLKKDYRERYQTIGELSNDIKELKQNLEFDQRFAADDDSLARTLKILVERSETFHADTARMSKSRSFLTSSITYWKQQNGLTKTLLAIAVIALLTFTLSLSVNYFSRTSDSRESNQKLNFAPAAHSKSFDSLVVMPFDNETGDEDMDFLSVGLADDLIRSLGRAADFSVISLSSARKMKTRNLGYANIRHTLQVENLLTGKVEKENGQISIEINLIDLTSNQPIWQDKFNAPTGDLLKLRNALTLLVAGKLQEIVSAEKRLFLAEYPTANSQAYKLFLGGKYARKKSTVAEFKQNIKILETAVALDPNYSLAYIALAENYNLVGTFLGQSPDYYQPKAKATLEKAIALDNSLAEAHTLLAKIKMDYEHDWLGCEREFKRAIELNPNYAPAHHWYGEVYLSAMKRLDESIVELETAHRLDPLSSGIMTGIAWSYIGKGEYEKALEECNKAFTVNPEDVQIYEYRAKAFFKLGRFDEAIADAEKSYKLDPTARYLATLGVFYARADKPEKAAEILKELKTNPKFSDASKYDLAIVEGALGNRDEAFRLLNAEIGTTSVDLLSIRIDPLLDDLRDDARLAELERKFKFPLNL